MPLRHSRKMLVCLFRLSIVVPWATPVHCMPYCMQGALHSPTIHGTKRGTAKPWVRGKEEKNKSWCITRVSQAQPRKDPSSLDQGCWILLNSLETFCNFRIQLLETHARKSGRSRLFAVCRLPFAVCHLPLCMARIPEESKRTPPPAKILKHRSPLPPLGFAMYKWSSYSTPCRTPHLRQMIHLPAVQQQLDHVVVVLPQRPINRSLFAITQHRQASSLLQQ